MGAFTNPTPTPEISENVGRLTETLRWPLRIKTADVTVEAETEEGIRVRISTTLSFPAPDSSQITEISEVNQALVRIGNSKYLFDLHGEMVLDSDGAVYTVEEL